MAKIKGIELKNTKDFRGHEGETLMQGDVYYKGKKVGYYSQDAWGGMDIFRIYHDVKDELRKEIENITNNYIGGVLFKKLDDLYDETYNVAFEKPVQKGYEYFFMDLMQLNEHEQLYKKYKKKYGNDRIYIIYNDWFNMSIYSNKNDVNMELMFPNKKYFEYNSLKDFVIE